jgi:anti-sigma B factor antagonist
MAARRTPLAIAIHETDPRGAQVELRGWLDLSTCDTLEQRLRELIAGGRASLTLDFAGVTFVDSTGLSVLISVRKLAQDAGGDVSIRRPRPGVRNLLETTGLDRVFATA